MTTLIEWTDETWNPVTGCTKVSPGCDHCYAERITNRFQGPGAFDTVTLHPERLDMPLRWRKPRRVFVNSMSDLFHPAVSLDFLAQVWDVMVRTPQHTYQILTKRPARMPFALGPRGIGFYAVEGPVPMPQPNIWLGTSVENQEWADERMPHLVNTPAAVRFLSCEPLLGPITFRWRTWVPWASPGGSTSHFDALKNIHWAVVGGESGPGARPMDVQWARSLVEQCQAAGVAVFVKQLGAHPGFRLQDEERRGNAMPSFHHFDEQSGLYIKAMNDKKGGDPSEWPEELQIREMPHGR